MRFGMKATPIQGARQRASAPEGAKVRGAAVSYLKVKRHLVQALSTGRWAPGERMPSEAELVAQFGVSRMTVNRALRELQDQGLVERVQGAGTFAAALHRVSSSLTIRDLHQEIAERGHHHHAHVELARQEVATGELAEQLGLAQGAAVFHTLIVHFENGAPLQCEDRYVNPACAPDYLKADFTQITPTHYLLQVAPLWQAQYSIEAALATAQEARLLCIAPREPCLVLVRRTMSRGSVITLARLVHPGSSYRLQGEFSP